MGKRLYPRALYFRVGDFFLEDMAAGCDCKRCGIKPKLAGKGGEI